jgi:UTP:GlnB (protein PII) uridylyltransferase
MDESTMTMPPEFLASYTDSMPTSYRQQQSAEEISEHARIVWRRGHEPAHAEIWQKRLNAVVICVVCDERPGLLALIRATIAAHGLDVLAAQAYQRKGDLGRAEAVHFLWLSPKREGSTDTIGDEDVAQIAQALGALLRGETDLGAVIERASLVPTPSRPPIDVGFASHPSDDGAVLLTVEADDRPGLLMTITTALYDQQISVVHSEVSTVGKRARGRFQLLEANGDPLGQARATTVARAVYAALSKPPTG